MKFSLNLILALSLTLALSDVAAVPSARAEFIEKDIPLLCKGLDQAFKKRHWGTDPCHALAWKEGGKSVKGRPLIYYEFGPKDAKNVTLVLSMVHGDEITPLYLGFQVAEWAIHNLDRYPNAKLVLAPLVNPDGFFGYPKSRMNAHGVDCNRNFSTKDWDSEALSKWKHQYRSNKRRYPGPKADSEPETLFQKMLIEKYKPNKIVSIHSPLNMIDYDGPNRVKLKDFSEEYVKKCLELRNRVKAKSSGFFPGSLGNYAGNERGIPTITIELPTTLAWKAKKYWQDMKKGIVTAITYEVPPRKRE